jgi:hypothetical protein
VLEIQICQEDHIKVLLEEVKVLKEEKKLYAEVVKI